MSNYELVIVQKLPSGHVVLYCKDNSKKLDEPLQFGDITPSDVNSLLDTADSVLPSLSVRLDMEHELDQRIAEKQQLLK